MGKMNPKKAREKRAGLSDWVKQAMFDAISIWLENHDEEISQLIVEALSERIDITYTPRLNVKKEEKTNDKKSKSGAGGNGVEGEGGGESGDS